jgi:hypothetical protein
MTRSRLLLTVPAVLAVAACGGESAEGTAAPATAPSSSAVAGSTPTGGPTAGGTTTGSTSGAASASLEFEDQSGVGDSATVARVSAPEAGFVVVLLEEDDDRPVAERLLGSTAVPVGSSIDVAVPLAPALTQSTELEAALYADTDGNGAFDPAADRPVPEPDDDDDLDDDVDDDAEYRLG